MVDTNTQWLALVVSLPTHNATVRMRLWRAVKAGGCAVLRDGIYLLPGSAAAENLFGGLATDVVAGEGSAQLLSLQARDAAQEAMFRALFERTAQFAELLEEIGRVRASLPEEESAASRKALKVLRRDFEALAAIDFFPGAAQAQAQTALSELEQAATARFSPGEPRAATGDIMRLDRAAYQGRLWATRRHLWVDRIASAWLIRRFIDPAARFQWLDKPTDCPSDALGFDFDGAAFTHVGSRVTFEVLVASFSLENDAALTRLAALVHFLDAGGIPVPEAVGIEAVLGGLRADAPNDDQLLTEASRVFDGLYRNFKKENPDD